MSIESFGAKCPHCSEKSVWSKIEPNSMGAFQFDACTSCGFIEFETNEIRTEEDTTKEKRVEMWNTLIGHLSRSERKIQSLSQLTNLMSVDSDSCLAFDYSSHSIEKLKTFVIDESEIFSWSKLC